MTGDVFTVLGVNTEKLSGPEAEVSMPISQNPVRVVDARDVTVETVSPARVTLYFKLSFDFHWRVSFLQVAT